MTLRFGILTASDRSARGERPDASGPALSRLLQEQGWSVNRQALLPDDQSAIRDLLASWADGGDLDVMSPRKLPAWLSSGKCPAWRKRCARPA